MFLTGQIKPSDRSNSLHVFGYYRNQCVLMPVPNFLFEEMGVTKGKIQICERHLTDTLS